CRSSRRTLLAEFQAPAVLEALAEVPAPRVRGFGRRDVLLRLQPSGLEDLQAQPTLTAGALQLKRTITPYESYFAAAGWRPSLGGSLALTHEKSTLCRFYRQSSRPDQQLICSPVPATGQIYSGAMKAVILAGGKGTRMQRADRRATLASAQADMADLGLK